MIKLRTCKICNLDKELSIYNFYKRNNGFRWECKSCTAQNRKDRYQLIKNDRAEYIRDYYRKNKNKILKNNKLYFINNKDKILVYKKSYYQDNKQIIISKNHKAAKIRRKN